MFRTAFAELGELRGIVSRSLPFVALSATVTYSIYEEIKQTLYLKGDIIIAVSPECPNLKY